MATAFHEKNLLLMTRCGNNLQEWNPGDVLEEGGSEASLTEAVLEEGVAEVTGARKDDGTC